MNQSRQPLLVALAALVLCSAALWFFLSGPAPQSPSAPTPASAASPTDSDASASAYDAVAANSAFVSSETFSGITAKPGDPAHSVIDLRLERDRLQQLKTALKQSLEAKKYERLLVDLETSQLSADAQTARAHAAQGSHLSPVEKEQKRAEATAAEEKVLRTRLLVEGDARKAQAEMESEYQKLDDQIARIDRQLERATPIAPDHIRDWRQPPPSSSNALKK